MTLFGVELYMDRHNNSKPRTQSGKLNSLNIEELIGWYLYHPGHCQVEPAEVGLNKFCTREDQIGGTFLKRKSQKSPLYTSPTYDDHLGRHFYGIFITRLIQKHITNKDSMQFIHYQPEEDRVSLPVAPASNKTLHTVLVLGM